MLDIETWLGKNNAFLSILGFYIRRRPWRFWIVFPILWWRILLLFRVIREPDYQKKVWHLILKNPLKEESWKKLSCNSKGILKNFELKSVIGRVPTDLLRIIVPSYLDVEGLAIDLHGTVTGSIQLFEESYAKFSSSKLKIASPHTYRAYLRKLPDKDSFTICSGSKLYSDYRSFVIKSWLVNIRDIVIIGFAALFVTYVSELIATNKFNWQMTQDVLADTHLMILNILPVFIIILIAYTIVDNVGWGILLGSIIPIAVACVNFFMYKYRSYPFSFSDIFLASEAADMGERYSYILPKKYLAIIFLGILLCLLIAYFVKSIDNGKIRRSVACLILLLFGSYSLTHVYQNDDFYKGAKVITRGNIWSFPNRYATNGVFFSFLNTTNKGTLIAPKGYNKAEAIKALSKYNYNNIPKNKQVNIITIQLEAYNDFSKWSNIKIDPSVYAGLNEIRSKSMSGHLTTTIFGGGTIDTERKMLTGYPSIETINQPMNSFVNYFNEQGYVTRALHPGFGWFYNRQNIDPYLGFDKFRDKENYYDKYVDDSFIVPDDKVFPDLVKQFNQVTKNGKKMFNQTVTYQNHGPYSTEFSGKPLVTWQNSYNKNDYGIINNYLTGIKATNEALVKLINSFEKSKKPIVLAFWGDHNPWGGDNNSTYKMLGIDLNYGEEKGFHNYFDTPYVMWANSAAKKMLKTDFKGDGPNISPMYILPTIFEHLGIKGSAYMQATMNMKKDVQVFGYGDAYIRNNKLVHKLPSKIQKKVDDFEKIVYYLKTNHVKDQRIWSK